MIPSPFADAATWDVLDIGGVTFSGAFVFSGTALKRKLDRRHSPGRDGARIRDKGYDLAELSLSLRCYEEEHWTEAQALIALLFPRGGDATRRNAHACNHPALALAGITKVYATEMDTPAVDDQTKAVAISIKLVEYRDAAQVRRNVSRRPAVAPDIGANRTAFTGTEAVPPAAPTPPATPQPT